MLAVLMREMQFIEELLPHIARFVRSRYADRNAMHVSSKAGPVDLLTEVDLEVQRRIQRGIWSKFAGDVIIAEEEGLDRLPDDPSGRCWVLDPIDGTMNFVRGLVGTFGVSVAFANGGRVVAAGVAFPELDLCFTATRGGGAMCNGAVVGVSEVAHLSQALLEIDFARPEHREPIVSATAGLLREVGQVRCHGSAVLGLCSVADGHGDAYVHAGPKVWDFAAAAMIVEEAGGTVTDFEGRPLQLFQALSTTLVASNGRVHEAVLDRIQRARAS